MPTCLEVAGATYPAEFRGKKTEQLDGRSMSATLFGKKQPPIDKLFFNDKGQQSVISEGKWKLLIEPGWYLQTLKEKGIAYELYDLENDPTETKNLADSHPEIVKTLEKECEQWKQRSGILDYAKIIKLRPNDPF